MLVVALLLLYLCLSLMSVVLSFVFGSKIFDMNAKESVFSVIYQDKIHMLYMRRCVQMAYLLVIHRMMSKANQAYDRSPSNRHVYVHKKQVNALTSKACR